MTIETPFDEDGNLLSPSDYLRKVRPERYSDSSSQENIGIRREELDFALHSLTERNDHKAFERFTRAIAQREVCKNLRPATGPEGGGDGKVDSESYPVSDDVHQWWYEGHSGEETWAVSVSAKKAWKPKVISDVKSIAETGRGYTRVLCFTNQNPSQKIRKTLEDSLREAHGLEVTIYDRSWLIEKTLENRHLDVAHEHLGVGTLTPSTKLGPRDVERQEELDALEREFSSDNPPLAGTEDAAWKARSAAILSRGLERPKHEVVGRFARAEEMARLSKNYNAIFRVLYDRIWTNFFWYDSVDSIFSRYDEMAELAFKSSSVALLDKLSAISSLLVQVPQLGGNIEGSILDRLAALRKFALDIASDPSRPNASREASAILAVLELQLSFVAPDETESIKIRNSAFARAKTVLLESDGLAELSLDPIHNLVELAQKFPSLQTEEFDPLFEMYAEVEGKRLGEVGRGITYLNQAISRLDDKRYVDAIGYFGQAILHLTKDEAQGPYASALAGLSVAYRAIDLNFAARAANLASLIARDHKVYREDTTPLTRSLALGLESLAWTSLETGHYSECILSWAYLRTVSVQLNEEDRTDPEHDACRQMDGCLACAIAALPDKEIAVLRYLPDALDALGLWRSQAVLLHKLGWEDELNKSGFNGVLGGTQEVQELVENMLCQPAVEKSSRVVIETGKRPFISSTNIGGLQLEVTSSESGLSAVVAESLITSIEAFHATIISRYRIFPRANTSVLNVQIGQDFDVSIDPSRIHITITWPGERDVIKNPSDPKVWELFQQSIGMCFAAMFACDDFEAALEELIGKERAMERSVNYAQTHLLAGRLLGYPFSDIKSAARVISVGAKEYSPKSETPEYHLPRAGESNLIPEKMSEVEDVEQQNQLDEGPAFNAGHKQRRHLSPINLNLWDAAGWTGMMYAYGPDAYNRPTNPILALSFKNPYAGYRIFETWREEYGDDDHLDNIRIGVLTGVNALNPPFYAASVGPNMDNFKAKEGSVFTMVQRQLLMEPKTDQNLMGFEASFQSAGQFTFTVAMPDQNSPMGASPALEVGIKKSHFHVTEAWRVGRGHPDAMMFPHMSDPVMPEDESDIPYTDLKAMYAELKAGKPVKFE
jgi:hypothetical protein